MTTPPSWPPDTPEHLAEALREQGAAPEEITDLMPALLHLGEWQAPRPTPAETQRLLARLTPTLPAVSLVRQAIRQRQMQPQRRLAALLEMARVQVSILRPAFWLLSLLVTLVGALVIVQGAPLTHNLSLRALFDQHLLLRAIGPGLAFLGTRAAFRGADLCVLELELACRPASLQLALARLVIVLGYDVALGLLLSLILWTAGPESFLALTLHWLMPLLLVAGLALLLSLRLGIYAAAALAYGGWLVALAIDSGVALASYQPLIPLTTLAEVLLGLTGLALLTIALRRMSAALPRLLPRP